MPNNSVTPWPMQFQTHPLLHGFTPTQLDFLANCISARHYQPGEEIVQEGELSTELYFILCGQVELLKYDEAKVQQYGIGTLTEGAAFGEIAFMHAAPRTCTIKALTEVDMWVLARETLEEQAAQGAALLQQLQANIAQQLAGTLQERTDAYVLNLQAQLTTLRTMNEFGQFFIGTVMGFSVATLMNVIFHTYVDSALQTFALVSWIYLAFMLLPVAYFMQQSARPWRDFGVTWANWRKVTVEAVAISALLLAILTFATWLYATAINQPLTSLFAFRDGWLVSLLYLPHSYLQELIGRGAMQNSLQRFFRSEHNTRALIWSSTIFAMIHSHFGLAAMLFTFLSGLLFGVIFNRQQNLIGVTIVHWALGLWVFGMNLM